MPLFSSKLVESRKEVRFNFDAFKFELQENRQINKEILIYFLFYYFFILKKKKIFNSIFLIAVIRSTNPIKEISNPSNNMMQQMKIVKEHRLVHLDVHTYLKISII